MVDSTRRDITDEEIALGLTKQYTYDDLGRVTLVDMLEGYNSFSTVVKSFKIPVSSGV